MSPAAGGVPNSNRAGPNPDIYSRQFDAGQSIAFVINRIMMESSYVYEQQSIQIDKDGKTIPNGNPAQLFSWYNILCFATPTDKWDNRRNDFAYKIKYVIVPYETPVVSEYFPNGQFRGAHKNYNYWFTGQNQEVLHFEVVNNNAYYNVINTPSAGTNFKNKFNPLEIVRAAAQARTTESDQGAKPRVNDIASNAADWLYNAVDYAEIRLRILGDPAWINAENYSAASDVSFSPFRTDGSINFSTGPAYFTMNYNLADDYNLSTGLMNIQGSATVQNVNTATPKGPALSFNYTAVECRSSFRQGRFEQELVGRLRLGNAQDLPDQNRTRTGTSTTAAASIVRQPLVGVQEGIADFGTAGAIAANQGIQAGIADIPSTVTIGDKVLPVLVQSLNPANRPLLNVSPRPYQPGVVNPPVPSGSTPNSNGGQNMNRDP
jgi:hypothetical protein